MQTSPVHPLVYGKSHVFLSTLQLTHEGYGHWLLSNKGDRAFWECQLCELTTGKSETIRLFLPLLPGTVVRWHQYALHLLRCEASGPPHDQSVPVELFVTSGHATSE